MGKHNNHQKSIDQALRHIEHYCAEKNLRLTAMRRRVFEILWQQPKALTAAEIMEKLGNKQPPITYRALEFLTEHGMAHKISTLNAYVGCTRLQEKAHVGQLLICADCRHVIELVLPQIASQISHAVDAKSFHIKHMHMEILGQCDHCYQGTPS